MNHSSFSIGPAAVGAGSIGPAAVGGGLGSRAVDRAVGDLRRGVPVVLCGGPARLLALAAETASPATLQEFLAESDAGAGPALLLAASRAARLTDAVAAGLEAAEPDADGTDELASRCIRLASSDLDLSRLRALADPTRPELPDPPTHAMAAPWPEDSARAAMLLAKLGRLLPAMLIAQADPKSATGGLLEVGVADILAYPELTAVGLLQAACARVPLQAAADTRVIAFRPADGGIEHLAVLIGQPEQEVAAGRAPLARIHSECFTGDLLGSLRCDCGPQLHQAIGRMSAEGSGVLLYMAQEGRGIGLVNKLRAYALQDGLNGAPPLDTLDANHALGYGADERSFAAAATMLKRLGITRIRLLTNNPGKVAGLVQRGIEVAGRVSHAIAANGTNDAYLETKVRRFGHMLG